MGKPITPLHALSRARSPEGNFSFLRREDFSGFFPEPFLGAIIITAAIITATATATPIIIIIIAIVISSILIKVKAFLFGEIL